MGSLAGRLIGRQVRSARPPLTDPPEIGGAIVNIGEPLRIIEVEPLWIPLLDVAPAPTEQPVPEPEPEPTLPVP
jgi:hypothetical protein